MKAKNTFTPRPAKYEPVPMEVTLPGNIEKSIDNLANAIYQPLRDTQLKIEAKRALAHKALIKLCSVYEMEIDEELGTIEVFARKFDQPNDTGSTEMVWKIEQVLQNGEEITLNRVQMDSAYDALYGNPETNGFFKVKKVKV